MQPGRSYRVINGRLLESLARSFNLEFDMDVSRVREFGGSLPVMSAKGAVRRSPRNREATDPRIIDQVITELRDAGQLNIRRPATEEEFEACILGQSEYVHEHLLGTTPVRFAETDDRPAITVWVCEPTIDLANRTGGQWDFSGSFLFLVEELAMFEWGRPYAISGMSALRMIVDFVVEGLGFSSTEVLARAASRDEHGRWVEIHPTEKLRQVGGQVGMPRRIETVYKLGYMTDEQSTVVDGTSYRCHDILAYPLFVAD